MNAREKCMNFVFKCRLKIQADKIEASRMNRMSVRRTTKQFLQTTTLHGFKYLCANHQTDRVCWVSWCVASACCAGVLCAVLWARFMQIPALLALRPVGSVPLPLPALAVCLPALGAAELVVAQLSTEREVVRHLVVSFSNILDGKEARKDHLILLEKLLVANNLKVPDIFYETLPPCHEFVKRCRWQDTIMPCRQLFHIRLTRFGVCCVMQPKKLKKTLTAKLDAVRNFRLSLLLQCTNETFNGCQFFTRYQIEGPPTPVKLTPGSEYLAQLTFKLIQDSDSENLIGDGNCVSSADYSETYCRDTCMERLCRCSNPFRRIFDDARNFSSPCRMSQMNCIRNTVNASCDCKPACSMISTNVEIQDSPITSVDYVIDPFYAGIDASSTTVLNLQVTEDGSRVFTRHPTETWFTLLSSLGGVFSMFLGVGLFSALELMFFLFMRVPKALNHAPEMDMPVIHVHPIRR